MAGIIADVRGALGGQVACLLAWASIAAENGDHIAGVRLNVKSATPNSQVNYLNDIFDLPPVEIVDERRKIRLNDAAIWPRIERTRAQWMEMLRPKPAGSRDASMEILHVRTGDRQPNSVETYKRFAARHKRPLLIMGNDPAVVKSISDATGHAYSTGGAVEDWRTVRRAHWVYGGWSYFTLSAALLEPDLMLTCFGAQDGPVVFSDELVGVLRAASTTFLNVGYVGP